MYFYVSMRKILAYNWFHIRWTIHYFFFKKICARYVLFYSKSKHTGKCLSLDHILAWCNTMFDANCWWWYIGRKMPILLMWSSILTIVLRLPHLYVCHLNLPMIYFSGIWYTRNTTEARWFHVGKIFNLAAAR